MSIPLGRTLLGLSGAVLVLGAILACSAGVAPTPLSSASVSSPPAASPAALPDGFPLGSWTTTITEADLRAGGMTAEGEIAENAGDVTLTMAGDGTWSTVQEAAVDVRWPVFRGTWTVVDADTFRQTTTFPADYAGDVVNFTWRIQDGALVLAVDDPPDPVLPIIIESHPWQPKE